MNYLVTYNHTQTSFSPISIHNTIVSMEGINDWWHYLPNVYILSTLNDETFISNKIINAHPGLNFLVVAVDLRRHNGVLPKSAWEWISKKINVLLRVKPISQNKSSLLDLLSPKIQPKSTSPTNSAFWDAMTGKDKK